MAKCKCGHGKKWHQVGTVPALEDACFHMGKNEFCDCMEYRPAKKVKEYHFDFCVSFPDFPEVGDEMAKGVMDLVIQFVETFHGQVGGGFNEDAE